MLSGMGIHRPVPRQCQLYFFTGMLTIVDATVFYLCEDEINQYSEALGPPIEKQC